MGAAGVWGGRRLGAAAVSPVEAFDAKQRRVRRCCYEYLRLLRFSVRIRLPGPGGSCGFAPGRLGRGAPCAPGSPPSWNLGQSSSGSRGFHREAVGRSEKRIVFSILSEKQQVQPAAVAEIVIEATGKEAGQRKRQGRRERSGVHPTPRRI